MERDSAGKLWDFEKAMPRALAMQRRYRGSLQNYGTRRDIFQVHFDYTTQTTAELKRTLSADRMARYIALASGNEAQGFRLYVWNSALAEALYTPLQGLEVAMRNTLGDKLVSHYGPLWFDLNPGPPLHYPLPEMLLAARTALGKRGVPVDHGKVIAELNWGFWTGILAKRYETSLWRPLFRTAFAAAPTPFLRNSVFLPLDDLRRLRNRIAHHEPILNRNIAADYGAILDLLGWISPTTRAWVDAQSRVAETLAKKPL